MKTHAFAHAISSQTRVVHALGKTVHCIHCYRTLGTAENAQQRMKLQRGHACAEGLLAKQPASPPPYN